MGNSNSTKLKEKYLKHKFKVIEITESDHIKVYSLISFNG